MSDKALFEQLERKLAADQQTAAKVLGVTKSAYSQYRSGVRVVPLYIRYAVELLMMQDDADLQVLKSKRS